MWSPINHIPHRDLAARAAFVVISTGNGTTLTLSGSHIVYLATGEASASRRPAAARDVKVRAGPAERSIAVSCERARLRLMRLRRSVDCARRTQHPSAHG